MLAAFADNGAMSDVSKIARTFSDRFKRWDISLPPEALERREGGHIYERGWHIGYQWGERNGEEYLDVISQHRMTSDSVERIWASGCVEALEAVSTMLFVPPGATPEEERELKSQFYERNARIAADLRERGLLPPEGGNLPAHEINEHLAKGGGAHPHKDDPESFWERMEMLGHERPDHGSGPDA